MQCQICGRERQTTAFSNHRIRVCSKCESTLGYDRQKIAVELENEIGEVVEGRLRNVVQQELPKALFNLITEKHNEIDVTLRVI